MFDRKSTLAIPAKVVSVTVLETALRKILPKTLTYPFPHLLILSIRSFHVEQPAGESPG